MNCINRIKPYEKVFGDRVAVRKDLFLVMGVDELELMKIATAVTFAIEKRPWRVEVDLWKSFVGVGWEFLEGLGEEWWQ